MKARRIGVRALGNIFGGIALMWGVGSCLSGGQVGATGPGASSCEIKPVEFEGWKAEEISNEWVKLILVPQLGGRLMQVIFGEHPYLFVNPELKGRYIPPSEGAAEGVWFNYGGDKIWPMPEGSQDAEHWPGPISDELDDGNYKFTILSQGARCGVRLEGPPDERTGLQYVRDIGIGSDSPEISFRAVMKNSTTHPIRWSMQSVTQYDTSDPKNAGAINRDFWAFAPANPRSAYLEKYYVRSGLAEDPSYSVKEGLFQLHYLYFQGEVWVDSPGSWLAVVDGATSYAMVERFHFQEGADYPGKASVIFYKNGPAAAVDEKGNGVIRSEADDKPLYMEAELNSPMAKMQPGETYAMDTEWLPARVGSDFTTVTDVGAIGKPLGVSASAGGIMLSGSFGIFAPGKISAHIYDEHGAEMSVIPLQPVGPLDRVELHQEIRVPSSAAKISVRFVDGKGIDRGTLGDAELPRAAGGS